MSEKERTSIFENFDKQIPHMTEEQKQFILGYMEGICQMSEKYRKESQKE